MTKGSVVLLSCAVLIAGGCGFFGKEAVPSAEQIRKWAAPFLVNEHTMKGVYRSLDVDSLVFTYRTSVETETAFWLALSNKLSQAGWTESNVTVNFREFQRIRPRRGALSSTEAARVAFTGSHTIVVAYVQADSSKKIPVFHETGESKWADKVIWPKFEELIK